jgi:acylphosphatase
MTEAVRTLRLRVTGQVQGVAYRAWTRRTALGLGLAGWVRNCADGSVEALISGEPASVALMVARLRDGPRMADVAAVEVVEEGGDAPAGFEILPTV